MAKCIRCGGSFLKNRKIKLKDAVICAKCFQELGFDKSDYKFGDLWEYDEIKNGLENATPTLTGSVNVTYGGKQRDLVCTEEEREIYDTVLEFFEGNGLDTDPLDFIRISDNYVTIKYGEWDLIRCKFTVRAKWLVFPVLEMSSEKHQIEAPEDVLDYEELITDSLEHIAKYS